MNAPIHAGIGVLHEWEDQIGLDDNYWRLNTYISYKRQLNPQTRVLFNLLYQPSLNDSSDHLVTAEPALVVGLAQHLDLTTWYQVPVRHWAPPASSTTMTPAMSPPSAIVSEHLSVKKGPINRGFFMICPASSGSLYQEVIQAYRPASASPATSVGCLPRPDHVWVWSFGLRYFIATGFFSLVAFFATLTGLQSQQLLNTHAHFRGDLLYLCTSTGYRILLLAGNQVMRLLNQGGQFRNGQGFKVNLHDGLSTSESRTDARKKMFCTLRHTIAVSNP
jgi:hypothetical protein